MANEDKKGIEGYIGGNSLIEMAFAYVLDKRIYLMNGIPEMDYTDEIWAMKPFVLNGNLDLIEIMQCHPPYFSLECGLHRKCELPKTPSGFSPG